MVLGNDHGPIWESEEVVALAIAARQVGMYHRDKVNLMTKRLAQLRPK
jgi:hypothetical protein